MHVSFDLDALIKDACTAEDAEPDDGEDFEGPADMWRDEPSSTGIYFLDRHLLNH